LLDPLQKLLEGLNEDEGSLEHHEVIVVEDSQFTLRYQEMMLLSGGNWDQRISSAMNDQHRTSEFPQHRPEGPLVGVIEIPGVLYIESRVIQHAKVRYAFPKQPQSSELQPMK
jgi:hypothetical protein